MSEGGECARVRNVSLTVNQDPASGIGYGFNAPYSQGLPGLTYYQLELQHVGKNMKVLVTETGWASHTQGLPSCSEDDKASWTVSAYQNVWLNDTRIMGVMPFMLQDPTWGDQDGSDYVLTNGQLQPVFNSVKQLRCSTMPQTGGC